MIAALSNVKTFFDANLQAAATTVATEQSVTTLVSLVEIITSWKRILQYPTLVIEPNDTAKLSDDDPVYAYQKVHQMTATIIHCNVDTNILQDNILVYSKAIEKLIAKNPRLVTGGVATANRVQWNGISYSDMVAGQKDREALQKAEISILFIPIAESDELGNIENA